jgi:hypothetical protein
MASLDLTFRIYSEDHLKFLSMEYNLLQTSSLKQHTIIYGLEGSEGTYLQSVVECATRNYLAKTPNPMLLASVANKAGKHLGIQPCIALSRGLIATVILALRATYCIGQLGPSRIKEEIMRMKIVFLSRNYP